MKSLWNKTSVSSSSYISEYSCILKIKMGEKYRRYINIYWTLFIQASVGSVIVISAESEIGKPSSNFSLVYCIHFHTIDLGKSLNTSLLSNGIIHRVD